jgi:hypothetical protein
VYGARVDASGPALVNSWLTRIGADFERLDDRNWTVRVPSAKREIVAVAIAVGERTVALRAFFMRGPDRDAEGVYRRILMKNLETRLWRFAIDDAGDLWLVADAETSVLGADGLDGMLGLLSTYVDETWESVIRMGFDVPDGMRVSGPPPLGA